MSTGRSFGKRFSRFLIFVLLTVVTIGFYPIYFYVSRTEEQNQLLDNILQELQRRE